MDDQHTSEDSPDEPLSCLSDETSRRIVTALRWTDPGDRVHARELVPGATMRTTVVIRHGHLPTLEEAGLVERDRPAGVVYRGEQFDLAIEVLEAIGSAEIDDADDPTRGV